ncbi:MAG: hypothetical protein PSX81_09425 [bacterium]|nr:hypothetical protein [bacterium]
MLINYKSKFSRTFLFIALMQFAATSFAQVPVVKIGASKRVTEIYEGINLYDSSSNSPTQWEWNVYDSTTYRYDPVDPVSDFNSSYVTCDFGSTPNSQNPSITFYRDGYYTVTLRCRNATGWSNKLVINKYIHVIGNTNYNLGFGTYGPNNDNVVASDYGSIIDDGGTKGNYSNNQGTPTRSFLVIHPCNAKSITLNMTQLKFADSSDVLKVYDDILPNNANLIATWTKGQTTGRTVTAYSGSMYLSFISNGSGIDSGYFGTYTSVLDTAKANINMDFDTDSVFNNVPIRFENKTTGFPGVPAHRWSVDGSIVGTRGEGLNYRFFSDGQYNLCLNSIGCDENRTVCKTITVSTPANPTKINFAKNSITNKYDRFSLKPMTNKADQFEWTISPSSYILLNPPSKPSTYTPGKIIYRDCPGDTLPSPNIWFLDSTCYTITLTAWNSYDSAGTLATLTKNAYICATDFRKTHGLFGKVYIDNNSDCSLGNGDAILENIPVKLYDSTNKFIGLTYTGQNGLYLFEKTNGKFKVVVDLNELPLKSSCPTGVDSIVKLVTGIYS